MPHYRLYFLGADGHIKQAVDLECRGDEDAIEQVRHHEIGHGLELWRGVQRVIELKAE